MTLATLLATVALMPGQAAEPSIKLAGQEVPLRFPSISSERPSDDFLNWHGWTFAPDSNRMPGVDFPAAGDWKPVVDALKAPAGARAVDCRVKFVIFRTIDILDHRPDGTFTQRRSTLEGPQFNDTLQAIARFSALVNEESGGQIKLVPQVDVEEQPQFLDGSPGHSPFGTFADEYLTPRLNGGGYEADDRVYRGPYTSVFCLHPALTTAAEDQGVMGSPVHFLPLFGGALAAPGALEMDLYRKWFEDLRLVKTWSGDLVHGEPGVDNLPEGGAYGNFKAQNVSAKIPMLCARVYKSSNVTATFVPDPEKGSVLEYVEKGLVRTGGLSSALGEVDPKATPLLSFWVKSKCRESLAVRAIDATNHSAVVSIGTDALPPVEGPDSKVIQAAFVPNGEWQRIVVNVGSQLEDRNVHLVIGPSENGLRSERTIVAPVDFEFDRFEFLKPGDAPETLYQAPAPDFASDSPRARLAALAEFAKAPRDDQKPQVIKLLSDLNDDVRLNATMIVGGWKDPNAEDALTGNATNLDSAIDEAALEGLAKIGTDSAWATIRHALLSGTTNLSKITAARLIASKGDPQQAGPLSVLFAQRSWCVRKAGAEAIGSLPGQEAPRLLMDFLGLENDPAVKLAATKAVDPSIEELCKQLMYSSVNDPSDAVRAWSNVKLILSPLANYRKEGFRGVRDDGRATRMIVLQQLAAHPSDENRTALQLAVADTDAQVRALALRAFSSLPGQVSIEEVSNTLQDRSPLVQQALIDLAITKKLSLPKELVKQLQASSDPEVARRAKELGE